MANCIYIPYSYIAKFDFMNAGTCMVVRVVFLFQFIVQNVYTNSDLFAFITEWDNWSRWSICSKTCGQGTRMRTRVCRDTATGEAVQGCKGRPQQIAPCHVLPCPSM